LINPLLTYTTFQHGVIRQLTKVPEPAPGLGILLGSQLGLESLFLGRVKTVYEKPGCFGVLRVNLRMFNQFAEVRTIEDFKPEPADWIKVTQVPEIMNLVHAYPAWFLSIPVIFLETPDKTAPELPGFKPIRSRSHWHIRKNNNAHAYKARQPEWSKVINI